MATPTIVGAEPTHTQQTPSVPAFRLSDVLRTTDAKTIGKMYFLASFGFFIIAGAMAMLVRTELA